MTGALPMPQSARIQKEDPKLLAKVTRDFLEAEGYTVLIASSPAEALHLAEHFKAPIHLLLTDVVLPGMNGRELSEKLRSFKWPNYFLFADHSPSDKSTLR